MKADPPAPNPAVRRWQDLALISLFALFLLLPLLDLAFHLDPSAPPSENRLPAALPHRPDGFAGLKKFFADWEIYFNDHFGFCKTLVNWHNRFKWSLFQEQNANNVLVGTGGWIYLAERRMIEHFCGTLPFTEPELQAWQKLLEHRRNWLAQRGVKYIFVLAPDKHSVYPEFLPVWLKDLGGRTRADQFFDYMQAHSTVAVLDPRPVLFAAKNPQGHGLAFVYTDSFGHGWIPFLGYQFGEADFYWQYPLDGRLIERQKPVVVINEMLERFFNVTDPGKLFAQDVLP
ncbi:MAG TPA: hypothetical protein VF492_03095 [Verrucomicrobiae bacterium]